MWNYFRLLSGGLRYATTTGYYLTALQAETHPLPRGGTDLMVYGNWLSRDELLNEVWGYDAVLSTRTVDVHVAWLRQKLEPNQRHPQFILTIHGLGYKFSS